LTYIFFGRNDNIKTVLREVVDEGEDSIDVVQNGDFTGTASNRILKTVMWC
jgi:hypothetical protein